ncbi:MAG: sulfatase-like hydrolase/transferase [Helicobacteraceae bacterium]|jgi:phosphoglycerol transferase MdoB-like AlkP superfamily enzyme|nr:sulfatase-like hydrolase/transferase [Helicobacteraceae bacterium]
MRSFFGATHIRALGAFAAITLIVGLCLRLTLFAVYNDDFGWRFPQLCKALFFGAINDLFSLVFVLIVPSILVLPFNVRFFTAKLGGAYLYFIIFVFAFFISFAAVFEYLFWGAIHSRFNFIALDYMTNGASFIDDAFKIAAFITALTIATISAALFVFGANRLFRLKALKGAPLFGKTRLALFWIHCAIAVLAFLFYSPFAIDANRAFTELAHNGIYELFYANRAKSVDYYAFYPTLPKEEASAIAINETKSKNDRFLLDGSNNFRKITEPKDREISPNIVVVIANGLDKKLLNEYAPNISGYMQEGLSFPRMHASGVGVLRTIEAFSLSIPAIAGDSIVKRSKYRLFSVASIFENRGYARQFIYGGYGYYDNLGGFFSLNGYEVIDRDAFAKENRTFAFGGKQSDEDLFAEAIAQADRRYIANRRFHQTLLASSIKPPYNYPFGRIDVAPKTSREGATRYFDYAFGRFIDAARAKPWFDDTIFVVISDRSLAAKSDSPRLAEYETIAFFYAPKLIEPRQINALCSQIDIAPTLFGLLGWGYESRFFGRDLANASDKDARAFVATNTHLAYAAANGDFVILRPTKKADLTNAARRRAIAVYQTAFDLFNENRLKE